jgi:hypothetical protein
LLSLDRGFPSRRMRFKLAAHATFLLRIESLVEEAAISTLPPKRF